MAIDWPRAPAPAGDVRDQLAAEEHRARVAEPPVAADAPVEVRFMRPDEAPALSRCVFRSYGATYDAEWVYQPDRVAELLELGLLRSCVGVAADGEIVGHLGLTRDWPEATVGEAGQAVVDPRYRGHHLFTTLKRFLADWARGVGLRGIYSEATAAHPYTQEANLALGAHETGLLLGYIPATVEYRDIDTARGRRQSVTLFYLKTNDGVHRPVFVPARHRELVDRIFEIGGLRGQLEQAGDGYETPDYSRLDVHVRPDHGQAIVTVQEPGADLTRTMELRLRELHDDGFACVYADLPLARPATERLGAELEELGFFFGGVFPNRRGDDDVLRLQHLHDVEADPSDVAVASDLGRELLDYVCAQRPRA